MADQPRAWVLLQQSVPRDTDTEPPHARVLAVYGSFRGVLDRIDKIAQANPQYPMVATAGEPRWLIGPTDDEGFFGNRPVQLWAVQVDAWGVEVPGGRA